MQKKFIIQDSSFLISYFDPNDSLHKKTLEIFSYIRSQQHITSVIATQVFYETLLALIRKRISREIAEKKLWNLLLEENVFNYSILETTALRFAKKTEQFIKNLPEDSVLPANDLMILTIALEFSNSCVITFDKGMKKYKEIFPNIFYVIEETDKQSLVKFLNS